MARYPRRWSTARAERWTPAAGSGHQAERGVAGEAWEHLGDRAVREAAADDLAQDGAVVRGDLEVSVGQRAGVEAGPGAVVLATLHPGAGEQHHRAPPVVEALAAVLGDAAAELGEGDDGDPLPVG